MNPIERAISIFAPFDCVICGYEGSPLCRECAELLPDQISICFICGKAARNFKTCQNCINRFKPQHVWVASVYAGNTKEVVKQYKFGEKRQLAQEMAKIIESCLPYFAESPIVTYVPTAPSRYRHRGFDHAKLLAKELAKIRGWKMMSLLARQTTTRQLGAKRDVRKAQLKNAFCPINLPVIKNNHILLVDDVVTTGATLEVASRELTKAGARQVDATVFARTPKK